MQPKDTLVDDVVHPKVVSRGPPDGSTMEGQGSREVGRILCQAPDSLAPVA